MKIKSLFHCLWRFTNTFTCSLLMFSMMVQLSPSFFVNSGTNKGNNRIQVAKENSTIEPAKASAKEKVDSRTANATVYQNEDGSGYAVVTGYSQNYLDSNNKWQNIDNSLTKDGSETGYAFHNKANRYDAQFKEKADEYFLKVKNNGESLEMGVVGAQKGEVISSENNITYKNVLDKIDLSYSIGEDSIKEDIIVNEIPENKSISYIIKISKDLIIQNEKDSGLKITDKAGKLFWYLAVPSVIGRVTGEPEFGNYDLKKTNDEEYIASTNFEKLLPPEETGQYPFVIDPPIIIPDQTGAIIDNVSIYEGCDTLKANKYNSVLQAGQTTYCGDSRLLLKFSVPSLPNIDTAILGMASNEEKSSVTRVKAYRPTSDWDRSSIDWDNQPGIGAIESSATGSIAYNWWNFNLTNLVKEWSAGGANYGIGLMSNSPTDSRRNFLSSYVVDHIDTPSEHPSAFRPYITVYYNNSISDQTKDNKLMGLQSWSRYVTTSLADGNANVNIANGNLAVNFQDLSVDGLGFDTVLSHTYNSKKNSDSSYGFNWTLSANKHLEISSDRKKVTYIDETGARYDFNDVDGNGTYVEGILETSSSYYKSENRRPNGLNWGLKFDSGANQFVAISNANIKHTFDSTGKIIKEVDRNSNSLNYEYTGNLLDAIRNNDSSLKVKLFYDNNDRLSSIEDLNFQDPIYHSSGQKITYTYESGDLKTVSRYSGDTLVGSTTYNYLTHQLISVLDAKNQLTQFTTEGGKVSAIIDALDKKTSIIYDGMINSQTGTTRVISPKGNEVGADKNLFTSKYYYHATPNFHFGIVYKEDSPPTKTDANPTPTILTTQYDHNDDYAITAVTDSTGAVEASAYDDVSGLLVYQFTKQKYLAIKNSYNVGNYETGDWRLLDSYNANGVQTVYSYDSKGNLTKKSVVDGDNINLLHNPGYESASRIDANKDGLADWDNVCAFTPDPKFNFRWENLADYWCLGGKSVNKTYEISTDHLDGNQSQVVGYANNTDLNSANFFQRVDDATRTEPGQTYKLSWNYKQNTDKIKIQIAIINYDDHDTGFQTIIDETPSQYSAAWTNDSYAFQTPATNSATGYPYYTTEVFMRIIPTETGVSGKAWFDSVKLQKGTALERPVEKYSSFEYNPKGQVEKERTPESKEILYSWDNAGNLLSVTDPLKNVTLYEYDKNGNKLSKTEPEGNKTADPNDFKTNYSYNGQRLITSVVDAKTGSKTVYTYDTNGDLETTTTPNNLKTRYINDKAGRPSETINPYGFRTKVDYDANGNPIGITDPNKKNSGATYDSIDRLEKETDADNKETSFTYDKNDNVKVISQETKKIAYNYDANDRLASESINGTVASTYAYDKESNIISTTTGGNTIAQSYTLTDEITKVSVAGQVFSYHRNKNNQLTSLDKSNGDTASYEYNEGTQVKTISHLRNNVIIAKYAYEYDCNGNRTKITTTMGTGPAYVQNYKYDNNNQLLNTNSGTYTYDNAGNIIKRQESTDSTNTYTFDGNRMTGSSIYYRDGISPVPEVYGYDANGNMTSRSTAGNPSSLLHFSGNALNTRDNRASEIKGTASYVIGKYGQAIKLDNASYLNYLSASNLNIGSGTAEFWMSPAWSNDAQIHTLLEYFVDQDNYIRLNKTVDNKLELQYVKDKYNYGALNPSAITWTSGEWYQIAFSWDKDKTALYLNGKNIATHIFSNGTLKTLTSPADKITLGAMTSGTTASQYANVVFDEFTVWPTVKNLTEIQASYKFTTENTYKPIATYVYDSNDYLTSVTKSDGAIISYTYDSQKRLIKRTETSKADIVYAYDGDALISETQNNIITKYVYDTEGTLLYIDQGTNKYYPIYDGLGSITMLRDQAGVTVATYQYDEWGKILKQTGSINQPLRFASYYWDASVGLYHLGARWYDPTLMRFISVDPHPGDKDDSLSLNEYLYCQNNPITFVDPDGDRRIKVIYRAIVKKVRSASDKFTDKLVAMGVGDAAVYMSKNSKFWRYAMNHPYIVGAGVGIGGGACFVFSSVGIAGASAAIGNYIASQQWSQGSFGSVAESLKYHLAKHGSELGVKSYYQMTKIAQSLGKGRWQFSVIYGRLRFYVNNGTYGAYFDEFGKILTVFKLK